MLYILKHESGDNVFYFFERNEYTVGRKKADFIIKDDQSISRQHAIINSKGNCVTVSDCKSKYGTFYNGKRLQENDDVDLKEGDIIRFGIFESSYRFEKMNLVTAGSFLTDAQKKDLRAKLEPIGGSFVDIWGNSCSYLTIEEIFLTIKVLLALIDDRPIVTLKFWDDFISSVQNKKPPPDPSHYKPPMSETLMNQDISVNPARKTLFRGKTFVFTNDKVKKKMALLISKTGGTVRSWEKQQLPLWEMKKSKNKYIFINDVHDKVPQSLLEIYKYLEEIGERTVPLQEIALAVVNCSCEKDCNPKFNRTHNVFKDPQCLLDPQVRSLARNTLSHDFTLVVPKKETIISPSLEADLESIVPRIQKTPKKTSTDITFKESNPVPPKPELLENPPKRCKLEKTLRSCEPKDNYTSSVSTKENNSSDKYTHSISIPSKKRPAEDDLLPTPKKNVPQTEQASFNSTTQQKFGDKLNTSHKKMSHVLNPFAVELDTAGHTHLMELFCVKHEKLQNISNNPFTNVRSTSFESETDARSSQETQQSQNAEYSTVWISCEKKKDQSNSSTKSVKELDPQTQKYCDLFENSVQITTCPTSYSIRASFSISQRTPSTRKNFKPFKKVQLKYPRTRTLIPSTMVVLRNRLRNDNEKGD